ncbi:MAG: GAF domain-containing protein [Coriobacteriia bacterium]
MRQSARSDDKRDVLRLERLNRLYAVLSHVNEAILRIADRQELFEAACRIAVEDGGFALAWIGVVDPESRRIRVAAKHGRDEGYLDGFLISLDPGAPEGHGQVAASLRQCRPFITSDTEQNDTLEPWRDEALKRGFAASASLPLVVAGACQGVLALHADELGVFGEEEVALLTSLAADLSLTFESAQAAMQREQALQELETANRLLESANRLAEWIDLDELLGSLADLLLRHVGHTRVTIMLWNEEQQAAEIHVSAGRDSRPSKELIPYESFSAYAKQAKRELEPRVVDFTTLPKHERGVAENLGLTRVLIVPLHRRDHFIGFIMLDDPSEWRTFTQPEIDLAEAMSSQAAVAIENARLVESERAELARTRLLQDVAEAGAGALELEAQMKAMLKALRRHLGLQAGDVRLLSPDGKFLRLLASTGWPQATKQALREVAAIDSGWMASRVIRDGLVLTHEDEEPPTPEREELLRQSGVLDSRYIVLPLLYGNESLGIMSLTFRGRRPFTFQERRLFLAVARTMSQTVKNARLFAAERETARLNEALTAIDNSLHGTMAPDEILQRAVVEAAQALRCESSALDLREGDGWVIRYVYLSRMPKCLLRPWLPRADCRSSSTTPFRIRASIRKCSALTACVPSWSRR